MTIPLGCSKRKLRSKWTNVTIVRVTRLISNSMFLWLSSKCRQSKKEKMIEKVDYNKIYIWAKLEY
jgi:hypothetical protein